MLWSVEGGGCVVVSCGRRLCCGQLSEGVVLWSVEGGGCVVVS